MIGSVVPKTTLLLDASDCLDDWKEVPLEDKVNALSLHYFTKEKKLDWLSKWLPNILNSKQITHIDIRDIDIPPPLLQIKLDSCTSIELMIMAEWDTENDNSFPIEKNKIGAIPALLTNLPKLIYLRLGVYTCYWIPIIHIKDPREKHFEARDDIEKTKNILRVFFKKMDNFPSIQNVTLILAGCMEEDEKSTILTSFKLLLNGFSKRFDNLALETTDEDFEESQTIYVWRR